MDLERKHTQRRLEFSRCFVGPDRAEVAKRSNDVGPHVDDAIHVLAPFGRPRAHSYGPRGEIFQFLAHPCRAFSAARREESHL
jgi:hypothetical protein